MKCVFNKLTKKFTGTAIKWDTPVITADEIIIELNNVPDNTIRLNNKEDGIRNATQTELDADVDAEKDIQALAAVSSPALESAIEEFSAILVIAGITIPVDIKANITARIKGKLP